MNIKIKRIFSISFVLALLLCIGSPAWALTQTEAAELLASDGAAYDRFGVPVVIYGNTALIGAYGDDTNGRYTGSVYVFNRDAAGVWNETGKLTASDGAAYDYFGYSISISGDTVHPTIMLVGAYGDDDNGADSGSVYVFNQDAAGNWTEQLKLTPSDGAAGDKFGISTDLSGYTAIVGARDDDDAGTSSGSAYVFLRDPWGNWTETTKLTGSGAAAYDNFGNSVAISGDTALIGAYADDTASYNAGAGYIFIKDAAGNWTEHTKLLPSCVTVSCRMGISVALSDSGDTALAGAYMDDDNGYMSGSAYVFTRNAAGTWSFQYKLLASDGAASDYFGVAVDLSPSGSTAAVGAYGDDDLGSLSGSAYIFARVTPTSWSEQSKLLASDGASSDRFGSRVAVAGDTALVGAFFHDDNGSDSGSVYVYSVEVNEPQAVAACTASPPDMVSWWKGDSDATDTAGSSDGTLTNGATFAAGAVGDAFSLDGLDDYVAAPSIAPLITTNRITIQAWVKPYAYNNAAWCCAHIVGLDYAAGWGTHLAIGPSTPYLWSNNGIRVNDSEPLALNTWHHIAATYDGTTAKLYVNGVLKDTHNIAVSIPLGDAVMIGASNTVQPRPFNGLIDEVEIYSRALSALEIQAVYDAGDKGHCDNQPPVADAGMDRSIHVGVPVSLDGSESADPDENYPLTYAWSFVTVPAGSTAELLDPAASSPTFTPNLLGDYTLELVVADSLGLESPPDEVLVSTTNTPPVADAGPDDTLVRTIRADGLMVYTASLDGNTSYDLEGDPLTYLWRVVQKPADSSASVWPLDSPTTTLQVNYGSSGIYVVELVVSDPWVSASDTVVLSYGNTAPRADAGGNQSVLLGEKVYVRGTKSTDKNGDPLSYSWSLVSTPVESSAALSNADASMANFTPDIEGTYVVNLVVSDGLASSAPASATIEVTDQGPLPEAAKGTINTVKQFIYTLNTTPRPTIRNRRLRTGMTNSALSIIRMIRGATRMGNMGLYQAAYDKLLYDILPKIDGCSTSGAPDRDDWVTDCSVQATLEAQVREALARLSELL